MFVFYFLPSQNKSCLVLSCLDHHIVISCYSPFFYETLEFFARSNQHHTNVRMHIIKQKHQQTLAVVILNILLHSNDTKDIYGEFDYCSCHGGYVCTKTVQTLKPVWSLSKRYAMIRNPYNQIPHPALKTKREITKYINWQQFTKGTRGKPNEQLFPKQVVIQLPKIYKICH